MRRNNGQKHNNKAGDSRLTKNNIKTLAISAL